jgi:hypothetical protein
MVDTLFRMSRVSTVICLFTPTEIRHNQLLNLIVGVHVRRLSPPLATAIVAH